MQRAGGKQVRRPQGGRELQGAGRRRVTWAWSPCQRDGRRWEVQAVVTLGYHGRQVDPYSRRVM